MRIWIDEQRNIIKSDSDLLRDVNGKRAGRCVIAEENPYDFVVEFITNMVYGFEFFLIDADFSDVEMERMGVSSEMRNRTIEVTQAKRFSSMDELIAAIQGNWKAWMFTSGTTGLPKMVGHTFRSLTKSVHIGAKHKDDVWAMAFRLSHMAGLQVFFQALLNSNPLVYIFESRPDEACAQLARYNCTHISATPTFFRNLLPYVHEGGLPALTRVTCGGERFDTSLAEKIKEKLPTVQVHNIYALTEGGSIFSSKGDFFEIPQGMERFFRVSEDGELLIHRTLLGDFLFDGEWYNSHDLVQKDGNRLMFISRKSDLINVGGYKVNPLEVEEVIKQVPGVRDCVVKGRKNSVLGNILTAEVCLIEGVQPEAAKEEIQRTLKANLQEYKIPRLIKFVSELLKTATGKKVRK